MVGLDLGLGLARTRRGQWWPAGASWAADFRADVYMSAGAPMAADTAFGVMRNTPRYGEMPSGDFALFEAHEPVHTPNGLSIEPAATNLVTHSAAVDHATWVRSGIAVSTGQPDPAGGTSAVRIEEHGSGALLRRSANVSVLVGVPVTVSRLVKWVNFDWCRLIVGDGTSLANAAWAWVNLSSGQAGGSGINGTGYGYQAHGCRRLGSGYCLAWITVVPPTTALNIGLASAATDLSSARADIGSGAGIGAQCLIWNSQIETGGAPTSPIVSGAVPGTRVADELLLACPAGQRLTIDSPAGVDTVTPTTNPHVVLAASGTRLIHRAYCRA